MGAVLSAVSTYKHGFGLWLADDMVTITTPAILAEWNAQEFWEVLAFACHRYQFVAVDMSRTRSCDARALAALVMALRYTDRRGVELRLLLDEASPIRVSLADGHLDTLIPISETLTEALSEDPWYQWAAF